MTFNETDFPHWKQYDGIDKLFAQVLIGVIASISGVGLLISSFIFGANNPTLRFGLLSLSFLGWSFSWVSIMLSGRSFALRKNALNVTYNGGQVERIDFRLGRAFSAIPMLLGALFSAAMFLFFINVISNDGGGQYVAMAIIGIPGFAIVVLFASREVVRAPTVNLEMSPSGLLWTWRVGLLSPQYHQIIVDWSVVSEMDVRYEPKDSAIFRVPIVRFSTVGTVKWDHGKYRLKGALVYVPEENVLEFRIHSFPVNFNVACLLMSEFIKSSRTGAPITPEMVCELLRVPPLRLQRVLSSRR